MIQGQRVRLTATFKNDSNETADPTNVFLKYKGGRQAVVTLQYGVGSDVVKDSTGVYHVDIDTTAFFGTLSYRWYSTGTGQTTHTAQTIDVEKAEP